MEIKDKKKLKDIIEKEIKLSLNRHLVIHVPVAKGDQRDRICILIDEASENILSQLGEL